MRLFSESVKHTNTSSTRNILKVKGFKEIFFDVFEVEINKNKYPLEKVSDYNGNPVVMVPVVVEGKKEEFPFILMKGKQEILFNESNIEIPVFFPEEDTITESPKTNYNFEYKEESKEVITEKTEDITPYLLEDDNIDLEIPKESPENLLREKTRKSLNGQINHAKKMADNISKKARQKKVIEEQEDVDAKNKIFQDTLESSKTSLIEEFYNISENLKSEIFEKSTVNLVELKTTIDNKIQLIEEDLEKSFKNDLENFSSTFDKNLKSLIKEMYVQSIDPKIEKELTNIAKDIVEKVDTIDVKLTQKLKGKVDLDELKVVSEKADLALQGNVELHDVVNKKVNKALSRIGQIDNKVSQTTLTVLESLDNKIDAAITDIDKDYTERIKILEERTFDITDEVRKYLIAVIEESRNNLIIEIQKLKAEKPIEYVIESKAGNKEIKDWSKLEKEWDKKIHDKFENYKVDLRKYVSVYSSGGATNAVQYANGGIMKGNLIINGSIPATQYLGRSGGRGGGPSTDILNDVTTRGNTTTNSISVSTLSATIVEFDTTNNLSPLEGQLTWNSDEGTLNLGMGGGTASQQIGLEQYMRVRSRGGLLADGSVVWATSATSTGQSGIILGENLKADGSTNPMRLVGVATQDISNNQIGYVTTFGLVRNANLGSLASGSEHWSVGDVLYVSPIISGGWTNVMPLPPYQRIPLAMILGINNGTTKTNVTLMVRYEHGYHLEDLHGVVDGTYTHPNGSVLSYSTILSAWNPTVNLSLSTINASNLTITGSISAANYIGLPTDTDTLDSVTTRGNTTNNSIIVGSISAGQYLNLTQDDVSVSTLVRSNSANWNSVYTTTYNLSSNWQDTYTLVQSNSASWGGSTTGEYLPLSGGTLTGSLDIRTGSFFEYNTYVSPTNYERLGITWSTNTCYIQTEKGSGGGQARDLILGADSTPMLTFRNGKGLVPYTRTTAQRTAITTPDSGTTIWNSTQQKLNTYNTALTAWETTVESESVYTVKTLLQTEYDAITPDTNTFYIITDSTAGGQIQNLVNVNANYTILEDDWTVRVTANSVTINLPDSTTLAGRVYNVKNSGTGVVTVSAYAGSQPIDLSTSVQLLNQHENLTLQCLGLNGWIIL